jgi:hypothetical protein
MTGMLVPSPSGMRESMLSCDWREKRLPIWREKADRRGTIDLWRFVE